MHFDLDFNPKECVAVNRNKAYLERLLEFDNPIYNSYIKEDWTLSDHLDELFPQYSSSFNRVKSLLNLKKMPKDKTERLLDFQIMLDGLNLLTPNDNANLQTLKDYYGLTGDFSKMDQIIYDSIHEENFDLIHELQFLSGERVVLEIGIDFEKEERRIKEKSLFEGLGKHSFSLASASYLLNNVSFSAYVDNPILLPSTILGGIVFACRGIKNSLISINAPQSYFALAQKCLRADEFIEEFRDSLKTKA